MTKSNDAVIRAWVIGKPATGNRITTDGKYLYSYSLMIGYTDENGGKIVYNYMGDHFISMTTSHHVSAAKRYGFAINPPK